jgi:hypothetical protein
MSAVQTSVTDFPQPMSPELVKGILQEADERRRKADTSYCNQGFSMDMTPWIRLLNQLAPNELKSLLHLLCEGRIQYVDCGRLLSLLAGDSQPDPLRKLLYRLPCARCGLQQLFEEVMERLFVFRTGGDATESDWVQFDSEALDADWLTVTTTGCMAEEQT